MELNRTENLSLDSLVIKPNCPEHITRVRPGYCSPNGENRPSFNVNDSCLPSQAIDKNSEDFSSLRTKQPNCFENVARVRPGHGSKNENKVTVNVTSEKISLESELASKNKALPPRIKQPNCFEKVTRVSPGPRSNEKENRVPVTFASEKASPVSTLSPIQPLSSQHILSSHSPNSVSSFSKSSMQNSFIDLSDLHHLDMLTKLAPPISSFRQMQSKSYGLAHLRIGLHATNNVPPSWQFALLDSGCSDNLISVKALQAIPDFEKAELTTTTAATIRTANNDQSQQIHGRVHFCLLYTSPSPRDATLSRMPSSA